MYTLGDGERRNAFEFISLEQLVREAPVYERLPQPIRAGLRLSIWWTLFTQVVLLAFLIFVQPQIGMIFVPRGGFFLDPSPEIANSILLFAYQSIPYLIIFNLINLFLTLAVLTMSLWLMQGVREPVHWLATVNGIPAILNIGYVGLIVAVLGVIVVILTIIWIIIIIISIAVLLTALAMLFGAGGR